jgi:hypothetical protein
MLKNGPRFSLSRSASAPTISCCDSSLQEFALTEPLLHLSTCVSIEWFDVLQAGLEAALNAGPQALTTMPEVQTFHFQLPNTVHGTGKIHISWIRFLCFCLSDVSVADIDTSEWWTPSCRGTHQFHNSRRLSYCRPIIPIFCV